MNNNIIKILILGLISLWLFAKIISTINLRPERILEVYTAHEIYYINVDTYEITSDGTNIKQKFNSFAELNQQIVKITTNDNR